MKTETIKKTKYTKPESETSYPGQHPKILEFDRLKDYIRVGQGYGEISWNEKPLESEGFARCFGIILKNNGNLESALFHVDDIDLRNDSYHHQTRVVEELMRNHIYRSIISNKEKNELFETIQYICEYKCPSNYGKMEREEFQERMEELNKNKIIQARFIGGDISRIHCKSRIKGSLFNLLGIHVKRDLLIDTGDIHWDILYKPSEKNIYINSRKQSKVLKFKF